MSLLLASALAGTLDLKVPFPTERMYSETSEDRVCAVLRATGTMESVEVDDGRFRSTCSLEGGKLEICMALLVEKPPARTAPLECETPIGTVRMHPTPAFDPTESIWDGVRIKRTDVLQATFHTDVDEAAGLMDSGTCGIREGFFWVRTRSPRRRQHCTLVFPDQTERVVPITLVDRL